MSAQDRQMAVLARSPGSGCLCPAWPVSLTMHWPRSKRPSRRQCRARATPRPDERFGPVRLAGPRRMLRPRQKFSRIRHACSCRPMGSGHRKSMSANAYSVPAICALLLSSLLKATRHLKDTTTKGMCTRTRHRTTPWWHAARERLRAAIARPLQGSLGPARRRAASGGRSALRYDQAWRDSRIRQDHGDHANVI